jgi:phosphoribosyl 1,2-cyclic phosphodiesterase
MKAKLWGVRGSVPSPITSKEIRIKTAAVLRGAAGIDLRDEAAVERYLDSLPVFQLGSVGGNTACVELRAHGELLIFDAGSGLRELGIELMKSEFREGKGVAHIFLSHTHWDHIMGFPFFAPAFIKGNKIHFYGSHENLERRLGDQHAHEHFPVTLGDMAADFEFHQLDPCSPVNIGSVSVTSFLMCHPGAAFGYRAECGGKIFVYASDTEFKHTKEGDIIYLKNADVLVLDTMYTFNEALAKTDWGHCSPLVGVDIAATENVKTLALFHHEPTHSDDKLEKMLEKTIAYKEKMYPNLPLKVLLSYEGLEIDISE